MTEGIDLHFYIIAGAEGSVWWNISGTNMGSVYNTCNTREAAMLNRQSRMGSVFHVSAIDSTHADGEHLVTETVVCLERRAMRPAAAERVGDAMNRAQ